MLHLSSKIFAKAVSLFITFILMSVTNMSNESETYKMHEYVMPTLALVYLVLMIVPTQWKLNIFCFMMAMVYFVYQIYVTYDICTVEIFSSAVCS